MALMSRLRRRMFWGREYRLWFRTRALARVCCIVRILLVKRVIISSNEEACKGLFRDSKHPGTCCFGFALVFVGYVLLTFRHVR